MNKGEINCKATKIKRRDQIYVFQTIFCLFDLTFSIIQISGFVVYRLENFTIYGRAVNGGGFVIKQIIHCL